MTERITVYQKPTCSTCRKVDAILRELGSDYDNVNYYVQPISEAKLKELITKMGCTARELLRTKEALYKTLNLAGNSHTDDELIALMVENPDLLQRPIVEKGSHAVLARPAETIRQLFN